MREQSAILLVDDEAIILLSLKYELLGRFGDRFLFETASNAQEGLRVIDELVGEGIQVILVISDWLMPGLKGDEFLAQVKLRHPQVHCIIISGQADAEAIERAKAEVGLSAFIRKPWNKKELIDAVAACVSD